jgi:hypothetical protein
VDCASIAIWSSGCLDQPGGLELSYAIPAWPGDWSQPVSSHIVSGLVNTAQQIGGALGLAILATIANSRTNEVIHGGQHHVANRLDEGFRAGLSGGLGLCAARDVEVPAFAGRR